jgi:hypothetical protein
MRGTEEEGLRERGQPVRDEELACPSLIGIDGNQGKEMCQILPRSINWLFFLGLDSNTLIKNWLFRLPTKKKLYRYLYNLLRIKDFLLIF